MDQSCVPPGFRFHPTDEELVGYYLKKKVASQKIDLDVIRDIDLYRIEPWDLQDTCGIGYEEEKEWYFFSHKDKKYPTGTRTNRATMAGFWKATGRDKAVYSKARLIGMRKTLVFYQGRAPNGRKSDWIMHEYRLESDENGSPQEAEGWVVCRAFKKRSTIQTAIRSGAAINVEQWESTDHVYYNQEEEENEVQCRNMGSMDQTPRIVSTAIFLAQNPHEYYNCKQETLHDLNHCFQLPELDSPSDLDQLMKNKKPISHLQLAAVDHHMICSVNGSVNREDGKSGNLMDWRDLDRFVAAQLSHGHDQDINGCELLLLQNAES